MIYIARWHSPAPAPVRGELIRIERGHLDARGTFPVCFSATASFSVAAVTAVIGVAALRHVKQRREIPLAIVPLLFAFQQAVEGGLWLHLSGPGDGKTVALLAFTFLVFAEVIWPAYTALALFLIEPDPRRRRALSVIAVIGAGLSIYLLAGLIMTPPGAAIIGDSISYAGNVSPLSWRQLPYLLCTCGALWLSSHRIIQIFGIVVVLSFAVSAYVHAAAFISVWCFFAAADSTLLYLYFRRAAAAVPVRHA